MFKCLFFCVIFTISTFAQEKYPKDYFAPPLKIPIIFAGTFGELRSNHFHSGIDIKTQHKVGIPIYAPADGYVARIKVKQYGYGKALYLNHPNGYTTVYGHLLRYNKEIQKYVKSVQYKEKNYAFNEYFKSDVFSFKKGDLIGFTGDSGSSGGPHLHYEIRDTETDKVINPMHFGVTTADTIAPLIKKLVGFPLDKNACVNNSSYKTILPFKKVAKGHYVADEVEAAGLVGFGINVFDNQNLAPNKNGIYSLEMKLNGKRVYYHDLEGFSFTESKYINLLIDYEYFRMHGSRVQKTHKVENNDLSIYEDLINNGKVVIRPKFNYKIEIIAKDFHGNTSVLSIPVKGGELGTLPPKKKSVFSINKDSFSKYVQENVTIAFPKKSVYKDINIDFKVSNDTAYVHKPFIPLDRKYTLTFDTKHLSEFQKSKVYIANVTNSRRVRHVYGTKKDDKIYTTTKSFGTYTLKYDDDPPVVSFYNFKNNQNLKVHKTLKVRVKDVETGVRDYYATIDDEWVLMELNHKKGILSYNFKDKKLAKGKHNFKIIVVDHVGNKTEKKVVFSR